ncbi:hypothetical protein BT63DRAFT_417288 [Microthyrium microscopicum]|uniref:F-box domain-containing protein n=1 Tax=Microthyrium microscopicum TaxID=703497 RepID=A0A6A6U3B6_9PEZI|nr:hypothetical protein BT63DRAFT_417288 [Microthyrium microscopicum]
MHIPAEIQIMILESGVFEMNSDEIKICSARHCETHLTKTAQASCKEDLSAVSLIPDQVPERKLTPSQVKSTIALFTVNKLWHQIGARILYTKHRFIFPGHRGWCALSRFLITIGPEKTHLLRKLTILDLSSATWPSDGFPNFLQDYASRKGESITSLNPKQAGSQICVPNRWPVRRSVDLYYPAASTWDISPWCVHFIFPLFDEGSQLASLDLVQTSSISRVGSNVDDWRRAQWKRQIRVRSFLRTPGASGDETLAGRGLKMWDCLEDELQYRIDRLLPTAISDGLAKPGKLRVRWV